MSELPWWGTALQWGLWLVLMNLAMGRLARARARPAAQTPTGTVLRHPGGVLALGLVLSGMFGAFAALSYSSPTGGPLVAALFLLFALLGCYLTYAYFAERYEVRAEGLAYRTRRGAERLAPWGQICRASFGQWGMWFVLRLHDGTVLRLSALLVGLPAFAEALLRRVDPSVIADDSVDVLRRTARGDPPRVW